MFTKTKNIVVLCGDSESGKSTLATQLYCDWQFNGIFTLPRDTKNHECLEEDLKNFVQYSKDIVIDSVTTYAEYKILKQLQKKYSNTWNMCFVLVQKEKQWSRRKWFYVSPSLFDIIILNKMTNRQEFCNSFVHIYYYHNEKKKLKSCLIC